MIANFLLDKLKNVNRNSRALANIFNDEIHGIISGVDQSKISRNLPRQKPNS